MEASNDASGAIEALVGKNLLLCFATRTAVSGRSSRNNPAVRQSYTPCVHKMRSVLGLVAVHHDGVAKLDVATLEPSPRKSARRARFARPTYDISGVVLGFHIEIGMGVGPFDFRQGALHPNRLAPIEFGSEGMVGDSG
jgi:hypothetical protein